MCCNPVLNATTRCIKLLISLGIFSPQLAASGTRVSVILLGLWNILSVKVHLLKTFLNSQGRSLKSRNHLEATYVLMHHCNCLSSVFLLIMTQEYNTVWWWWGKLKQHKTNNFYLFMYCGWYINHIHINGNEWNIKSIGIYFIHTKYVDWCFNRP